MFLLSELFWADFSHNCGSGVRSVDEVKPLTGWSSTCSQSRRTQSFPSKSKKNQVLRSKEIRQRCGREPIESFENLLGHCGQAREGGWNLISSVAAWTEGNPSSRNLKGAQKYFRLSWTSTKEWTLNQKPAIMKAYNILLLQGLLYRTQMQSLPDHVLL